MNHAIELIQEDVAQAGRTPSSNGRTYPLKILHRRMRILYKSTRSYSSVEDNTFLKESRSMLGPYITSIVFYCCYCNPLIVIDVPL